jgi:hypothetical protein
MPIWPWRRRSACSSFGFCLHEPSHSMSRPSAVTDSSDAAQNSADQISFGRIVEPAIEVGTTYPDQAAGESGWGQDRSMPCQGSGDHVRVRGDRTSPGGEVGDVALVSAPRVRGCGGCDEPQNLWIVRCRNNFAVNCNFSGRGYRIAVNCNRNRLGRGELIATAALSVFGSDNGRLSEVKRSGAMGADLVQLRDRDASAQESLTRSPTAHRIPDRRVRAGRPRSAIAGEIAPAGFRSDDELGRVHDQVAR